MKAFLLMLCLASLAFAQTGLIDTILQPIEGPGIPRDPYGGTCYLSCPPVPGNYVRCFVMQRPGRNGTDWRVVDAPIDCATQCQYWPETRPYPQPSDVGFPMVPLPHDRWPDWRYVIGSWCPIRYDVDRPLYPACHSENYQYLSAMGSGPGDSDCYYPDE